jgi:hypothetical protein
MVDTIRLLLYGQSGTGKTTLWSTFPGPTLALICSGGNKPGELRSIRTPENIEKITPLVVTSSKELDQYLRGGKGTQIDATKYATVVLDHVSGLQDLILKEILGLDEAPVMKSWGLASQQQYGQVVQQCMEHLRTMLSLPGNVVVVAQERVFGGREDGMDSEIITPTIGASVYPSLARWLNPACDYVVQMFKRPRMKVVKRIVGKGTKNEVVRESKVRDRGVEYCARTEPHEVYLTKFRVPKGQALPVVITDPDYEKLMAVIRGEMPEGAEYPPA